MTPSLHSPNPLQYDLALQLKACRSKSRRNGKVARLPFALREQINHMLEDGVLYKTIIERLGDAGKHLTEDNIGNWRSGGHQDYLREQLIKDRAYAQTEAAADVLRESGNLDPQKIQKACTAIGLLQYMETLLEHGDQIAQQSLQKNPAKYITLLNACCNMSNADLAERKLALSAQNPKADPPLDQKSSVVALFPQKC